jgi:hypothetical protein
VRRRSTGCRDRRSAPHSRSARRSGPRSRSVRPCAEPLSARINALRARKRALHVFLYVDRVYAWGCRWAGCRERRSGSRERSPRINALRARKRALHVFLRVDRVYAWGCRSIGCRDRRSAPRRRSARRSGPRSRSVRPRAEPGTLPARANIPRAHKRSPRAETRSARVSERRLRLCVGMPSDRTPPLPPTRQPRRRETRQLISSSW